MMSIRRCLSFLAALVVTLSPAAFAEPAALCENSSHSNASLSQAQDAQGLLCLARLCETDEECLFSCSSARTAACIDNTCHYTYGTGGGGGGGGPICPARFCSDDMDCECKGRIGYCGPDSVCSF
ncbi:hypothetical protein [Cystobacter ferrugineus]|uniref:Dickkopf N-terminal cysteine-rich domain-containing protein n=1 Tax=Cystobacter ferrugineus TaxID=83449 RepID=A0A1L9B8R5_9BACT|nr:hypothetical protein [Cystobacter ferrugineus]OJH38593.1 hypothetical protein BON30_20335 [Cystobacter ferrugineus]